MNQRIRELIEEAGFTIDKYGLVKDEDGDSLDLDNLIELIVRECMQIADMPLSADGKYDHLLPSKMIAKHFGLD